MTYSEALRELLKVRSQQLLPVVRNGLVGVPTHLFSPLLDGPRKGIQTVIVSKGIAVPRYAGHLPQTHVAVGTLRGVLESRQFVLFDQLDIEHQAVLVHDWFEGVDDPKLLLGGVTDLLGGARVDAP